MKYLAAGIQTGDKVHKALIGGTMAATPISCVAGYYTLEESSAPTPARRPEKWATASPPACSSSSRSTACRLSPFKPGLRSAIWKRSAPCTSPLTGASCGRCRVFSKQLPSAKRLWSTWALLHGGGPRNLSRQPLYTSAAYTPEMIDDALTRFDRVFDTITVQK